MYLRKMGRRFLLLHSQRLGDGRVLQRRLGHFEQGSELRQSLGCARWREQFQRKNPDVSMDWRRLQEQAQHLTEAAVRPVAEPGDGAGHAGTVPGGRANALWRSGATG